MNEPNEKDDFLNMLSEKVVISMRLILVNFANQHNHKLNHSQKYTLYICVCLWKKSQSREFKKSELLQNWQNAKISVHEINHFTV